MVDLSKVKEGDTVYFRCGGKGIVSRIEDSYRFDGIVFISIDGYSNGLHYSPDGMMFSVIKKGQLSGPFDITHVEPSKKPEFDWDDVKVGQAFTCDDFAIMWYVAPHPDPEFAIFCKKDNDGGRYVSSLCDAQIYHKSSCRRADPSLDKVEG